MRMACEHVIDDIKKRYTPERLPAIEYKHLEIGVPDDAVLGDWGRVCQVCSRLVCANWKPGQRWGGRVVGLSCFDAAYSFAYDMPMLSGYSQPHGERRQRHRAYREGMCHVTSYLCAVLCSRVQALNKSGCISSYSHTGICCTSVPCLTGYAICI